MLNLLSTLWQHISLKRKKQMFFVVLLTMIASLAEILSIGAVVPFLAFLADPEVIYKYVGIEALTELFNINSQQKLLIVITIIFCFAALFSGIMRMALIYAQTKLAHAIGADLGYRIYNITLHQPYTSHISKIAAK